MATASRTKTPSEHRILPFRFAAVIPVGASLQSAVGYASRKVSGFTSTLAAAMNIEDATLGLNANPGVGSLLTVNPGGASEEKFKVSQVTGASAPFTCTLSHTAEFSHSSGENVNYEPGMSGRILVSTTATIVGSDALLNSQNGADGQTYRASALGTLDDGEIVELELDLVVSELAPTSTVPIQVDEVRDLAYQYIDVVALAGSDLSSAIAFVSRESSLSTTLAGAAAIGDTNLSLTANPGVGALLTLNPTGSNQEKLKVSGVSGSGPYACTVNPTPDFSHSSGETIFYEPGVSSRLLTTTTGTVTGTQTYFRKRRGVAGQIYRMTVLGTLLNAEVVQKSAHLVISED